MDIVPTKLHERVSVVLGSRQEVERLTAYHAEATSGPLSTVATPG